MIEKVIKRNGEVVDFEESRIVNAIIKSMSETKNVDREVAERIANKIHNLEDIEKLNISDIELKVIKLLVMENREDVADKYLEYKNQRTVSRALNQGQDYSKYKFLSKEFLNKYKHLPDPFPNELGKFVYYRTYSRPIALEKRRENWWETVARVVDFSANLHVDALKRKGNTIYPSKLEELKKMTEEMYDHLFNLRIFSSGRSLWVGGTKSAKEFPISNFNCAAIVCDSFKKFSETFLLLMLGSGMGISVEKKYVEKLPKINSEIFCIHSSYNPIEKKNRKEFTELTFKGKDTAYITIGDSKYGWTKALEFYFEIITSKRFTDLKYIIFDYNSIRPKGEPLKTFGGTASGHENIKNMLIKINKVISNRTENSNNSKWISLKPIDCLDIFDIIAENVVSGGVRRSSLIIFCDRDDTDVINAKSNLYTQDSDGNWNENKSILHRSLSNNSIVYDEKPSREYLHDQFQKIRYTGEPGIINREEIKKRRPDGELTNPCIPFGEYVLTNNGYDKIERLRNNINLFNKSFSCSDLIPTGQKMVYTVELDNGIQVKMTDNHKISTIASVTEEDGEKPVYEFNDVELKDLKVNDTVAFTFSNIYNDKIDIDKNKKDYKLGVATGELITNALDVGHINNAEPIYINEVKPYEDIMAALMIDLNGIISKNKFDLIMSLYSPEFKYGLIERLFDNYIYEGNNKIKSFNKEFIYTLQRLLLEFGIPSKVCDETSENDKYSIKINYELYKEIIDNKGNVKILDIDSVKIVNIKSDHILNVYDIQVPDINHFSLNGLIVHNCGEILLRDRGLCNLTETNMMGCVKEDGSIDYDLLYNMHKYASIIGYRMASVELDLPEWDEVNKEDRLVGVSLTGVMDFRNATKISDEEYISILKKLRDITHDTCDVLANEFNLNKPKLYTTQKPSGTVSLLPTVSSGGHYSHSEYYIRRIRITAVDPLAKAMEASGFEWEPEVGQERDNCITKVFAFPIKAPKGKTKYDVSAIEQLNNYKLIMENYVDHNASNTITVRENEWDEVEQWVWDNWNTIVGITFLSLDDSFYKLLPYEKINEETYNEMLSKMPKFNPLLISKYEDYSVSTEYEIIDSDCVNGVCPIR